MKITPLKNRSIRGNALAVTLVITSAALLSLAGILAWSSETVRLSGRSTQHTRVLAGAEAATEKSSAKLISDFLNGGEAIVSLNLANYRATVPTVSDSTYWSDWQFMDISGNVGSTYVGPSVSSNFQVLGSVYSGLSGFVSTYNIISNARETNDMQQVTAGVISQLSLTRIPVFQFAMYSSGDMEVSCGDTFHINGQVHANGNIYVEPDSQLYFDDRVTASGSVTFGRSPNDSRGTPGGSVYYATNYQAHVNPLTLPIGTTNTPAAVNAIIQPPATGESVTSAIGLQRLYNKVDMIVTVSSSGVTATSGRVDSMLTLVPSNELALYVTLTNSFYDSRESKTVRPIDINVGRFTSWSATNHNVRTTLGGRDVDSIYVYDTRNLSGSSMGAVRLYNGTVLPSLGLSVVTPDPLYIWGHYNETNSSYLGTSNTSASLPAMVAADAVTILSTNWLDSRSTSSLSARDASDTTVNAALLAGEMPTSNGNYSGGMENFPRFLETWSGNTFTYNGSMVYMYPSTIATNIWGMGNVYDPPARNWSYDINFNNGAKLPPLTPSLQSISKTRWATAAPFSTNFVTFNY